VTGGGKIKIVHVAVFRHQVDSKEGKTSIVCSDEEMQIGWERLWLMEPEEGTC